MARFLNHQGASLPVGSFGCRQQFRRYILGQRTPSKSFSRLLSLCLAFLQLGMSKYFMYEQLAARLPGRCSPPTARSTHRKKEGAQSETPAPLIGSPPTEKEGGKTFTGMSPPSSLQVEPKTPGGKGGGGDH